ncbi:MAG: EVE domain-containing protein [Phycisphaerales bacterium]
MATFLVKTEPGDYSFADLARDKRAAWTGVSNAAALIALRAMKQGDRVYIYHTGAEKAVVGEARVVSHGAYQDPKKPGTNDKGEPKFAVVDLAPVGTLASPVSLASLKADPRCKDFGLVRQPRLSVMPVSPGVEKVIRDLARG